MIDAINGITLFAQKLTGQITKSLEEAIGFVVMTMSISVKYVSCN